MCSEASKAACAPHRPALPQPRPPLPLPAAVSVLCRGSWRARGPCPGPCLFGRHDLAPAACRHPDLVAALAPSPGLAPCHGRAAGYGLCRLPLTHRGAACGRGPLPALAAVFPSARRPSACLRAAARALRRTAARCHGAAGRPCRGHPGDPAPSEACVHGDCSSASNTAVNG